MTRNRNGRSSTKSISSSGISAAVSETPSSVYAAPVTPFSSISSMAAWSALLRYKFSLSPVNGLKSARSASSASVTPSARTVSIRSVFSDTLNLGTDRFTIGEYQLSLLSSRRITFIRSGSDTSSLTSVFSSGSRKYMEPLS